ncbi:hypothetical protein [Flavobacterium magnesitis]|uniref:hypothetical protein n=1 Tax=Flavobacterium magnesitis TaxID=3138077 RepID=UPI00358F4FFA
MIVLIVVWFMLYQYIDHKVDYLNNFTYKSYRISQEFTSNIKNFQTFLLTGYKEDEFYLNHSQKDLKLYIDNLKSQKKEIDLMFKESKELNIGSNPTMTAVLKKIDHLYTIVNQFKEIAFIRGFKDYGIEGVMRTQAHFLEENTTLNKITLLQFRRHEKDYLLRSDETSIKKFEDLFFLTLKEKNIDAPTKQVFIDYKNNFDALVKLSTQLGVSENQGLYGEINQINGFIENSFVQIISHNKKRINDLKETLFYVQLCQTLFMILIAMLLCIYISKYFTKDIQLLSLDISNYIKSNFKESSSDLKHNSSIREVDFLLKSYGILKEKLSENIIFLEKKTEQANKIAAFKTQFLANMSHEIRSPLNGVSEC